MSKTFASSNVPAFLTKLWKLVSDPKYDHLIHWSEVSVFGQVPNNHQFHSLYLLNFCLHRADAAIFIFFSTDNNHQLRSLTFASWFIFPFKKPFLPLKILPISIEWQKLYHQKSSPIR